VKNEDGYYVVVSYEKYRKLASKQKAVQRQQAYLARKKANGESKARSHEDKDEEEF